MTRYSSTMSEAYKKVIYRNSISERDLTDAEEKRREEIAKDLPDQEFKDRYGARWKDVKMATATKMAKKESLDEGVRWKVKIEGLPPVYMDAGSASEVRTKLRKLVKQPDMVQDIDRVTDTQMKKDLRDRLAGKDKEEIEEAREKPARQLLNPNKEEMVVKKNTVIVIDKKDLDKYLKKGWGLAEDVKLEEMNPTDHVKKKGDKYCVYNADGSIAKEFDNKEDADKYAIANHDKLMAKEEVELDEQFDYVLLDKDNKIIARYKGRDAKKQAELNKKGAEKKLGVKKPIKVYPIRPTDKKKIGDTVLAIGEAKLIDKPTGEVLKTGSKKEMETERKRNRDELQVKEWFKSKGIDVTIRKLDNATQAYVRLGKTIPNEIREDLVKIQYGKLPVEFQDKNNIVYGNFKENSITMNNEFWKKVFEARKDDPSQEQDTNIIMQLRKSVSLRGMKDVEFEDGKKEKVKPKIANAVMDKFNSYRTTDQKLKFQQKIAKSYKDLLSALKEK